MNVPETFFTVHEELVLFGLSCLFGAGFGVLYDVFRTLRLLLPHNFFLVLAEDLVFLACYGIFLSAFASAAARGELRLYYAAGNALGFALYHVTLGYAVMRILRGVFFAVKKAIRLIFSPFVPCYVLLRKKAAAKFVGCSKIIVRFIKKMKKLLLRRPALLYNNIENIKRKNVKNVGKKVKTEQKRSV